MHLFCHSCGAKYTNLDWPRSCEECSRNVWRNPLPVVVMVVPIHNKTEIWGPYTPNGVLAVRRNIEPDIGKLAMPSGYIDYMEDWREAALRELEEEAGIKPEDGIDKPIIADNLKLLDVAASSKKTHTLIFCSTPGIHMPKQVSNDEVQELVTVKPEELEWDIHKEMSKRFLVKSGYMI